MATIHLFSLLLSPIFITTIHATSIPITNAGFESDRPNCTANTYWFNNGRVIGWTLYDPHNIITRDYNVGIANPQDGDAMNDPIYGSSPPEGNAVSWIVPSDDEGDGECGIQQTLSATLTPNTIYTLTAKVGNPGNNRWSTNEYFERLGWTGYIMQLLAGDEVLAQDDNSIYVDDYHWATTSVQFTTTSSNPQLGNALKIRLLQKNHLKTGAWILFFDDVRLDASPNTVHPSTTPTTNPTANPSSYPSSFPTINPSIYPTVFPTVSPTQMPSKQPHDSPTFAPTTNPTNEPTSAPTTQPNTSTAAPTTSPSTTEPSKYHTSTLYVTLGNQGTTKEQTTLDLTLIALISVVALLLIAVITTSVCFCRYRLHDLHHKAHAEKEQLQLRQEQFQNNINIEDNIRTLRGIQPNDMDGMERTIEGHMGMEATVEGPQDIVNRIGGKGKRKRNEKYTTKDTKNKTDIGTDGCGIGLDEFVVQGNDDTGTVL
eukprot:225405_1